jgi:hypothetical protein
MPPSGNRVHFEFLDIFRVADGMLIEHWTSMDLGALKRLRRRRDRRGGGRGELKEWSLLGFDAAASSGETVGTGRSSSVTTGWRRPPRSAFAQVSGSFAQWAHQAIDAKPT